MKKFLILLTAIYCGGCSSTGVTEKEPTQNINIQYYYESPDLSLYTAEIEGHLYIIYDGYRCGSIIHAEHCHCKMK